MAKGTRRLAARRLPMSVELNGCQGSCIDLLGGSNVYIGRRIIQKFEVGFFGRNLLHESFELDIDRQV
jgi:hypothetical protein